MWGFGAAASAAAGAEAANASCASMAATWSAPDEIDCAVPESDDRASSGYPHLFRDLMGDDCVE